MLTIAERKNVNLIEQGNRTGFHEGCIRLYIKPDGSMDTHERAKVEVCILLKKSGFKYITEARLRGYPGRIDVFDITRGIAFEITNTETAEELAEKIYPVDEIRQINAKGFKPEDITS